MSGRSHDRQRAVFMSATGQLHGRLRAVCRVRCHAYEVRRTTWNAHANLDSFGLLDATIDENRRPDGTVEQYKDTRIKMPHLFTLTDEGLADNAASTVRASLDALIH